MAYITKERFCEIMDNLVKEREISREMDKLLAESPMRDTRDFFSATCLHMSHEPLVVELLTAMFDDEEELVEYWMYEMDFGRGWYEGCMTEADGTPVILPDAASLYDYLVEHAAMDVEGVADEG